MITAIQKGIQDELQIKLGIEMDDKGILRCHGLLSQMEANLNTIFPKLLPYNSHYTNLAIRYFHEKLFHSGVANTLSQVRHQYWIIRGRQAVLYCISKCVKCVKNIGGP